jgi:F-type H+-transporting ATPase subunit delta
MKHISPKKYAISLYEVLVSAKANEYSNLIDSFIRLLAKHKMLGKTRQIIRYLKAHIDEQQNIKTVYVSTTQSLDHVSKKHIVEYLEKLLKNKIEILEKIKPELIGGVVIEYDDVRLDGSVRKQLEILEQQFYL